MSPKEKIQEVVELTESVVRAFEDGEQDIQRLALRASRIARLMGDTDHMLIFQYEASGYPLEFNKYSKEVWRLVRKAGRVIKRKSEDKPDGFAESAPSISLGEMLLDVKVCQDKLAAPGTQVERKNRLVELKKEIAKLEKRKMFIYNYVVSVYYEIKFSSVAFDVFDRTRERVDGGIGELIPNAVRKFTAVYENLASSNSEDWSNAVHSCRRILQETADVLYPATEDKVIKHSGKKDLVIKLGPDNYINRLMAYVEENSSSKRFEEIVGSHLKYLGERLDAIFQAAQKGSHAEIASQDEADRYVVYTYLVVGDILKLSGTHQESE